jgi:hypothetical protein
MAVFASLVSCPNTGDAGERVAGSSIVPVSKTRVGSGLFVSRQLQNDRISLMKHA